jgi:hypothetical protein
MASSRGKSRLSSSISSAATLNLVWNRAPAPAGNLEWLSSLRGISGAAQDDVFKAAP